MFPNHSRIFQNYDSSDNNETNQNYSSSFTHQASYKSIFSFQNRQNFWNNQRHRCIENVNESLNMSLLSQWQQPRNSSMDGSNHQWKQNFSTSNQNQHLAMNQQKVHVDTTLLKRAMAQMISNACYDDQFPPSEPRVPKKYWTYNGQSFATYSEFMEYKKKIEATKKIIRCDRSYPQLYIDQSNLLHCNGVPYGIQFPAYSLFKNFDFNFAVPQKVEHICVPLDGLDDTEYRNMRKEFEMNGCEVQMTTKDRVMTFEDRVMTFEDRVVMKSRLDDDEEGKVVAFDYENFPPLEQTSDLEQQWSFENETIPMQPVSDQQQEVQLYPQIVTKLHKKVKVIEGVRNCCFQLFKVLYYLIL
jgi:hypothetical protein